MTTLIRRAAAYARRRRTISRAHNAVTAALYGDYRPGHRLIDHAAQHGTLPTIAAAWCDAYLTATRDVDVELVTPLDKWIGQVVTAHANRDGVTFATLIADVPAALVRHHLEALLRAAAFARLDSEPDSVWP